MLFFGLLADEGPEGIDERLGDTVEVYGMLHEMQVPDQAGPITVGYFVFPEDFYENLKILIPLECFVETAYFIENTAPY